MSGISILIVEDEAITAMFMETMLIRRGYRVIRCVSSGEDAFYYAIKFKPDLIIMDIRLAGKMDGIETVSKIKTESSGKIQYIFITGYSDIELKDRAMVLAPLDFLIKPINLPEMVRIIESFFNDGNEVHKTTDDK